MTRRIHCFSLQMRSQVMNEFQISSQCLPQHFLFEARQGTSKSYSQVSSQTHIFSWGHFTYHQSKPFGIFQAQMTGF